MTPTAIRTRVARSVEFRVHRATAWIRNDRLNRDFTRDPDAVLDRIDRAIDRGVGWLLPQDDVSMSVLLCAKKTLERTGDRRFAFVHEKAETYRTSYRDPAFIIIDPDYDPDTEAHRDLPDVNGVRPYYPVENLMIDTAWAGHKPQPDIIGRLKAFDDNGFYGTTHIVVGGILLLENGGAPADAVRAMMNDTVDTIVHANEITARAEDIYAERAMVLQWLDRHDLIRPAWMMRLLENQRSDGGWQARNMPPIGESNQHTTIVTLATLAEFLARHRPPARG